MDSVGVKDKTDEQIENVVDWDDDRGTKYVMVADNEGEYKYVDDACIPLNRQGPT